MRVPKIFSEIYNFIFTNKLLSPLWLVARVYLGYGWISSGYHKLLDPVWFGDKAGVAVTGFVNSALLKTTSAHPDVTMWYAYFLKNYILPYADNWSYVISCGEVLVGAGLILGAFTTLSSFFGFFMNMNFLLAGTVSLNPVYLLLSILLIMARKVAGYIGLDYFILRTGRN
jgi:thiosulfate dehydrogenase [quinone] large subunit